MPSTSNISLQLQYLSKLKKVTTLSILLIWIRFWMLGFKLLIWAYFWITPSFFWKFFKLQTIMVSLSVMIFQKCNSLIWSNFEMLRGRPRRSLWCQFQHRNKHIFGIFLQYIIAKMNSSSTILKRSPSLLPEDLTFLRYLGSPFMAPYKWPHTFPTIHALLFDSLT